MGLLWNGCSIDDEQLSQVKSLNGCSSKDVWLEISNNLSANHTQYIVHDSDVGHDLPSTRWTFAHHAAYYGAPYDVFEHIAMEGFALNLPDGNGRLPCDVVKSDAVDRDKILMLLKPRYKIPFNQERLTGIQDMFYKVVDKRREEFGLTIRLAYPVLSMLLEDRFQKWNNGLYFPIPGMYGGFSIQLIPNEDNTDVEFLMADSWSRVCGGSGQRHKCTPDKVELLEEGFV